MNLQERAEKMGYTLALADQDMVKFANKRGKPVPVVQLESLFLTFSFESRLKCEEYLTQLEGQELLRQSTSPANWVLVCQEENNPYLTHP